MKENNGVIRTKKALKNSLVSLLNEKELREITIKEIVSNAGYTRGTYYAHYQYKEDLLDEIIKDTIDGFILAFKEPYDGKREQYDIRSLSYPAVKIFHFVSENSDAFSLFYKRENMGFQEKLTEAIRDLYNQEFDFLFPEVPKYINREIVINQSVYSVLGLISYWIKSDYMYSAQYMTEQMLEIAKLKHY
ncbi:TetR/AcrR family transcriptional regulator [Neobacillus mesonae]|nr:TetR/AcrR family transcriptional regulator [Neobacillus mesonae]